MLTTLKRVKGRLKIETADVVDDDLLTNFIAGVSARFENDCNRTFSYTQNVIEEFEGDETEVRVRYFPIDQTQPITFQFCTTQQASSANAGWQSPVSDPDYIIRKGCVISLSSRLARWQDLARVTYSGGYNLPADPPVTPVAGVPNLPDDLQIAAVEQIAYWYQNRNRLGLVSISGQDGHIQQFAQLDLLPSVKAVLTRYERFVS